MRDSQSKPPAVKETRAPKRRHRASARAPVDHRLTMREQLFVAEYLKDLNGTRAATRAGYSARSAGVTASRLLIKANVNAALQSGSADRQKRTEVTADRVLRDIDAAANLDMAELFDEAGRLKSIHAMPPHVRRAIVSI